MRLLVLTLILMIRVADPAQGAVWFVSTNGNDAFSGTSWALAKRSVIHAMTVASDADEIWVGRGRYVEHITMKAGVALLGGFSGVETGSVHRDWNLNVCTLDGSASGAVITITAAGAGRNTRVDGFTITRGRAIHGGGVRIVAAAPTLANNRIVGNISLGYGAGVSCRDFDPFSGLSALIAGNIIADNYAADLEGDGAGIACIGSSPTITNNVIVRNNAAQTGGGIACWRHSQPLIANNFIGYNSARLLAGAETGGPGSDPPRASAGGGGIFASATDLDGRPIVGAVSAPTIVNNVIVANGGYTSDRVFSGGGITLLDSRLGSGVVFNNTIVANNGPGVFWANTAPHLTNNIVAFNTIGLQQWNIGVTTHSLAFNCVYGHTLQGTNSDYLGLSNSTGIAGNISEDPRFANARIGDLHLQPDSPCVNAGAEGAFPAGWTDIDGQARILAGRPDLGADESDGTSWEVPTPVYHVHPEGNDGNSGLGWTMARRTVQSAIHSAAVGGGEVWVAAGTYEERLRLGAYVHLFGGFSGTERSRSERNPAANPTILDGSSAGTVLTSVGAGFGVSTVDGFTLQHGVKVTETLTGDAMGGGILCQVSSPIITNNRIIENSVGHPNLSDHAHGGGIACYLSYARIANNLVATNEVWNRFDGMGGGIYCLDSSPSIEANSILGNQARSGPGIGSEGSAPWIVGNLVAENRGRTLVPFHMGALQGGITAILSQGVVIRGNTVSRNVAAQGAGLCVESSFNVRLENNVITDNQSLDPSSGSAVGGLGGGLYFSGGGNTDTAGDLILNNTVVGNTATGFFGMEQGGGMALVVLGTNLTVANNLVVSNSSGLWRYPTFPAHAPVLRNNCVNNGGVDYVNLTAGATDFLADPLFVDRAAGDFRLLQNSPCIDRAADSPVPSDDRDLVARPLNGDLMGAAIADVGAYEYVHPTADTDGDGMTDAGEVMAGTNPVDQTSWLRLAARLIQNPSGILLSWLSVEGRRYGVDFTTRLAPAADWQILAGGLVGSGAAMEVRDDDVSAPQRFYRLNVETSP